MKNRLGAWICSLIIIPDRGFIDRIEIHPPFGFLIGVNIGNVKRCLLIGKVIKSIFTQCRRFRIFTCDTCKNVAESKAFCFNGFHGRTYCNACQTMAATKAFFAQ